MKRNIRCFEEFVSESIEPKLNELLSVLPTEIDEKNVDNEILRTAIISELDAINLYEQFASKTKNKKLAKILLDIAREEKTHVGEFQSLLLEFDKEQLRELKLGKKEVEESEETEDKK